MGYLRNLRTGAGTPSDLLEVRLAALAAREPQLAAFETLSDPRALRDAARASTERWRNGEPLSPLDGATVAVKDIIETRDLPTGQGSPIWEGFESRRDAASVQALRAAGVLVLGKSTTTEFASTAVYHTTTNPHDPERTPGGSSSGSAAAVGAGMADLALGSQVVGSTLRPASYCGCYGFKPSFGALNRGGSYDYLSQSCMGLFATDLEDLWALAKVIADRVGGDPGFAGLSGPEDLPASGAPRRIAVLGQGWAQLSPGAQVALETLLARLRAEGVDCVTPERAPELAALQTALRDAREITMGINAWESRWPLGGYFAAGSARLSSSALARLRRGEGMTRDDYAALLARRDALRAQFGAEMRTYDMVLSLSAPGAAPRGLQSTGDPAMVVPASLLGVPAISLPLAQDEGLPLGVQVIGRFGEDADIFAQANGLRALLSAA